jgi:hypothetical protein
LVVADFDGDGKADLALLTNIQSKTLAVLLGNGDGTFQPATAYDSGGAYSAAVAVADLNGDHRPDLVVANQLSSCGYCAIGSVGVLLNNTPLDTTPPLITISATPKVLWPPNGRMLPVTVSGTITDAGSGVNVNSAAYAVKDEYGKVQPKGAITLGPPGQLLLHCLAASVTSRH